MAIYPMMLHIWSLYLFLVASLPYIACKSPSWNGHTTPGSRTPARFTPYYVPPGTKSYDSSSPLVLYTGKWVDHFSSTYIHKSLRSTSQPGAAITFTFTGTGIEWFGNTDNSHGIANVYIDAHLVQKVDTWSSHKSPQKQQRIFWKYDLACGKHTIKIVNTAQRPGHKRNTIIDLDAFVVTKNPSRESQNMDPPSNAPSGLLAAQAPVSPARQWSMIEKGSTGVNAMQIVIVSSSHALIIDKVEHNPLSISGHPAWTALYNLNTHSVRPLHMQSNSFCAGGTFLGNGTLINVGGNPVVHDHTSSADFGDVDGLQAIRLFHPCDSESADGCEIYENHSRIRMASPRWYNTVIRISDGSAMIIGGSKKGGWINNATTNNPTIEFYPPKNIHGSNGMPTVLPFLKDTLNSNLFPIAFVLPEGRIFMAANRDAMIYDWTTQTERRLPQIPNGVRVTYPMTGTALLLPLSPENGYTPEVLICGGSNIDDTKAGYDISSQDTATKYCSRLVLTESGIAAGWMVEEMPEARTMLDAVLLPTGQVVIVNGAETGISGYGNVRQQVGTSNADHPVLTPVLYTPNAVTGQRFSSEGLPSSQIPRLYHSVATLTPNGDIMVAGSNPNLDRSEIKFGTEYRVEWIGPPYMRMARPEIVKFAKKIEFGQTVEFRVNMNGDGGEKNKDIKVALMDLGYVTHAVHANSRMVYLRVTLDDGALWITGPPDGNIYPPGPGWIYVLVNGVPSKGVKVMIGNGGPPVDEGALNNVLMKTAVDQYEKDTSGKSDDGAE